MIFDELRKHLTDFLLQNNEKFAAPIGIQMTKNTSKSNLSSYQNEMHGATHGNGSETGGIFRLCLSGI